MFFLTVDFCLFFNKIKQQNLEKTKLIKSGHFVNQENEHIPHEFGKMLMNK